MIRTYILFPSHGRDGGWFFVAHSWLGLAALAILVLTATACVDALEQAEPHTSSPKGVPVAAIFYQWFGYEHDAQNDWPSKGGLGTFHWNDIINSDLITGLVVNRPDIGYYASDDDETIAWQLQKINEAGIDTIIVSWWG